MPPKNRANYKKFLLDEAARKREEWAKLTPEEKSARHKKKYEYVKAKALRDPEYAEKIREKWREAKRKRLEKNKQRVNEYQREYYANDPNGAEKQNERRQKREPYRIIRASSALLSKGVLGIDQYLERVSHAIALADEITVEKANERRAKRRRLQHRTEQTKHEHSSEADSNKDQLCESVCGEVKDGV